jgi:hypothetical protein
VMGQATPAGEMEFWLTRFKPGWAVDALRHTWPDFLLDAQFVSIWKDIDPCRLCFRVEGITAHLIELSAPCPELIDAPAGMRGVRVQLNWGDDVVTLRLNGVAVAQSPLSQAQ